MYICYNFSYNLEKAALKSSKIGSFILWNLLCYSQIKMITEMLTSLMVLYFFKNIYLKVSRAVFFTFQVVYITCQSEKGRLWHIDYSCFYRTGVIVVSVFSTHTLQLLSYQLKEQRNAKISFPESMFQPSLHNNTVLLCINKWIVWSDNMLKKQQVVAETIKKTLLEARQGKKVILSFSNSVLMVSMKTGIK